MKSAAWLAAAAFAAALGATGGPVLAETSVKEAVRHPIRTMKQKMRTSRTDDRAERTRSNEMPGYGSSSGTGSMDYGADRDRTRERAMNWVRQRESGGMRSGSDMRQGGTAR